MKNAAQKSGTLCIFTFFPSLFCLFIFSLLHLLSPLIQPHLLCPHSYCGRGDGREEGFSSLIYPIFSQLSFQFPFFLSDCIGQRIGFCSQDAQNSSSEIFPSAPHQGILEQPFISILATSCITQFLLSSRAHPLKVQAQRPLENGSWSPARLREMLLGKWTKKEQDPHCLQMPRKHVHRRHTEPS